MHLRSKETKARYLWTGFSLLLLLSWKTATAQVDLSAWPSVRFEVMAVDADGNPFADLTAAALEARGPGKARSISDVSAESSPQSVCLLLDASDADRWSMEQAKAKKLIRNLPEGDEVCVATCSSRLSIAEDWTKDRLRLSRTLALGRPEGGTQLRDAVLNLAESMRSTAHNKSRAVILLSDGTDEHSTASWTQYQRGIETAGSPTVHMLCLPQAFGGARRKQVDPRENDAFRMTGSGGGMTYFPHTMGDLNGAVAGLPIAMSSRYVVTYVAENESRDGHEERIQVSFHKAHRNKGVRIQAPEGYYAPSQ